MAKSFDHEANLGGEIQFFLSDLFPVLLFAEPLDIWYVGGLMICYRVSANICLFVSFGKKKITVTKETGNLTHT